MKAGKLILTFALVAVVTALGACSRRGADRPPMELRTYAVPAENQPYIESALRQALTIRNDTAKTPGESLGRVSSVERGVLLVAAPGDIQGDIARFLAEYPKTKRAPESRMAIDFWVVSSGEQAAGTSQDPRLGEINEVLETISKAQAVQGFKLVERLSLIRELGEQEIQGGRARVEMEPLGQGVSKINIEVGPDSGPPGARGAQLRTVLKFEPGQTVVLGQSGIPSWGKGGIQPGQPMVMPGPVAGPAIVFYVVRTRALD